jgi:hypothetical protein
MAGQAGKVTGTSMQRPTEFTDAGLNIGEDSKPGKTQSRWGDRQNPVMVALQAKDDGPATVSAAYEYMLPRWKRIDDLLGGTATMRAAGETYLPMHPYETSDNYEKRLTRATLRNYTLRTLENLTAKAFKDPPKLGEDVEEPLKTLLTDVDQQGTDFVVFARAWFREALAKTVAYVLVDFSRTDTIPRDQRTKADDEREGVRPFWRMYCPEDVLFQRKEKIDGAWKFTEVRLLERELVPDGAWGEKLALRIRVLRRGAFELYELRKKAKNSKKAEWMLIDGGPMSNAGGDVPFVDFYTARDGLGEGKPPLEDLAFINIEHWQSASDQRNILTVTRFPMLAVSGANAQESEKPVVIGPNKFLSVADPNGRIYYVEHAGRAIEAGAKDLEVLEDQMASYGAEFLRRRPGTASATGRVLDSAEAISPLQAMAIDFKDALERALQLTADWLNVKEAGSVTFQVKPDISLGDGKDLDLIDAGRDRRDISRIAWINEMKRRDILPEEFDADKDKLELDKEPKDEEPGVSMTLRTGRGRKASKASRGGNPSDKRGPDKTETGEKQPIAENHPT